MKKNRFIALTAALVALTACNTTPKVAPAIPQDKDIEAKVEKLLKEMTLEEMDSLWNEAKQKGM